MTGIIKKDVVYVGYSKVTYESDAVGYCLTNICVGFGGNTRDYELYLIEVLPCSKHLV